MVVVVVVVGGEGSQHDNGKVTPTLPESSHEHPPSRPLLSPGALKLCENIIYYNILSWGYFIVLPRTRGRRRGR